MPSSANVVYADGAIPPLPDGWQYGVIVPGGGVWGCGGGRDGLARMRRRLAYGVYGGKALPCFLPSKWGDSNAQ